MRLIYSNPLQNGRIRKDEFLHVELSSNFLLMKNHSLLPSICLEIREVSIPIQPNKPNQFLIRLGWNTSHAEEKRRLLIIHVIRNPMHNWLRIFDHIEYKGPTFKCRSKLFDLVGNFPPLHMFSNKTMLQWPNFKLNLQIK